MPNIMLDLETLDNKPTSAILSLGAVCDADPSRPFNAYLELEPQFALGCTVSTSTVMWWFKQSDAARADQVAGVRERPQAAMDKFAMWVASFGDPKEIFVWGNGASFDVPIVRHLAGKLGIEMPWPFWNDRCYRTLKTLYPEVKLTKSNGHTALGDALNQMQHLHLLLTKHNQLATGAEA